MHLWRRARQPTPVFLPGESHGWRSLMGYSPRGCKELDTTEQLHFHFYFQSCQKVVLERSAWKKSMTNLESVLKSRDITLLTKVHLVKAMIFPVVMYGCENWTINKAEHGRINAFELWCWRRLLRVPWTARRSNQSILKEISPKGNQS